MMITHKKRILRAAVCMAGIVTIASATVYAEPSSSELESKTSNLQGEINDLNTQLSGLSEELDAASAQVEELTAAVEKSKLDVTAAKLSEQAQYDSMKDRIQFMYEGGSVSLLEVLLSSENMADFLNKAEFISNISDYDRQMLDKLTEARANIEKKQSELEKQQEELNALQTNLSSKKEALNSKLSSASGELADYSAQLERAKAAEAASASAAAAAPQQAGGGNQVAGGGGSVNTGGNTPVDANDTVLFAALLECEAGGSSYDGMLAVATVVLNRVASSSYPGSISGVIYQSGQFAPTWDGSLNRVLGRGPSSTAYSVAQDSLGGARHSAVLHCYSFNAAWTGASGINIGGNVFW